MIEPSLEPTIDTLAWPFPFSHADWEQTPPAVQAYIATWHQELAQLKQRVEALEARTHATSQTSSRRPSSDSPYRKGRKKRERRTAGRPGAKPGHLGTRQIVSNHREMRLRHIDIKPGGIGELTVGVATDGIGEHGVSGASL
jgi:Family of unknown function (DUF6444)